MLQTLLLVLPAFLLTWLSRSAVLVDFQVAQPLTLPKDAKQCTVLLVEHTFGFSYGSPAVVDYTPPTDCGPVGSWAGVSLNFTVTSNGTQYDRLVVFTLDNVEIWRSSTPEPTRGDGIIWTYLKDVSQYMALFSKNGTFVLQLDNLIQTGLDGEYASTLQATFYQSSAQHPPAPHADLILPISTLANNSGDVISVPPAYSLNVTLPKNAIEIYAEVIPSGNSAEEFWPFNVANEYLDDLPSGTTYGDGPFREVRLSVDGQLAGVVFPYVVVFTGGISPTLWRPIAAYGALDLPSYYIDLTPFVPILVDGNPHAITLEVISAETDHAINQNWYVTANLQIVTDPSGKPTKGKITKYNVPTYAKTTTTGNVATNGDVNVTVKAVRALSIEAQITSGSGKTTSVAWSQALSYTNTQGYYNGTLTQDLYQLTSGTYLSLHNGLPKVSDIFTYPFTVDFNYLTPDFRAWTTNVDHSYMRAYQPSPFITGSTIHSKQVATAFFQTATGGNYGNGTSSNSFQYIDLKGNTYTREVSSVNSTITSDKQGGSLTPVSQASYPKLAQEVVSFATPRLPGGRHGSN